MSAVAARTSAQQSRHTTSAGANTSSTILDTTTATHSESFIPIPPTPSIRHNSNPEKQPYGLMKFTQEPTSLRKTDTQLAIVLRNKQQRRHQQLSGYGSGGAIVRQPQHDPRNWRECIPFHVPTNPEIMMAHADDLVHSQSLKYTNDRGMRIVKPLEPNSGQSMFGFPYATSTISLQREKGVIGMSLRKYSTACMESDARSYPGIVQHPPSRQHEAEAMPRLVQEAMRTQYYNIHSVF